MTSADIAESYGHVEYAREIRKFEAMVNKQFILLFWKIRLYSSQILIDA